MSTDFLLAAYCPTLKTFQQDDVGSDVIEEPRKMSLWGPHFFWSDALFIFHKKKCTTVLSLG
jgi:hypothetical protein